MTIKADTISKLLGVEPVEVVDIPGRVVSQMEDDEGEKSALKSLTPLDRKRMKQREYNRRYLEKKKAMAVAQKPEPIVQPTAPGTPVQPVEPVAVPVEPAQPVESVQRFEVPGLAAFRVAQALFEENLLTCSMVIDGNKLQFVFTARGK